MRPFTLLPLLLLAGFAFSQTSSQTAAQNASQTAEAHTVPTLDGGIGSCPAALPINDDAGKPVYNATIKVHIAYGTWGIRKLDLQINTNVDGKARFTGLPERVKRGLMFQASDPGRYGEAFDDPAETCNKQFTISLQKKP